MKAILPVLAFATLIASGCAAPRLQHDVTSFHDQLVPAGETIRVVAADPAKAGSLEFRSYASRISEELREAGYTPVSEPDVVADLIAEVDYSVATGSREDRSLSIPGVSVGLGRWSGPWHVGVFSPLFRPRDKNLLIFVRTLELNIVEAEGAQRRIYEGRAVTGGGEGALNEVMPYLITALFADFPGESGKTTVVEIEAD